MQTYWQTLVKEFQDRKKPDAVFLFSPLDHETCPDLQSKETEALQSIKRARIYLGGKHAQTYLTHREAMCVAHAMRGNSIPAVGAILDLSPRTVEYYLKNVRNKLNCARLADVIRLLLNETTFDPEEFLLQELVG